MAYLLNLVYLLLLILGSPWLVYAAIRKGKYREGLAAKFLGRVPVRPGNERCIWLHAVSVGEVNLLGPLLARLEQQHPDWVYMISTTTKTGFDLAKKKYGPRTVFYCPLDFSWAVRQAIKRVRPNLLVLAELELWPNLIRAAKKHGARVAVVNGRLSDRSLRGYRRVRPFVARLLQSLDAVAAQNAEYASRFCELGAPPDRVHLTGSIKFDGADGSRQPENAAAGPIGRHPARRHRLSGGQYSGARRAAGTAGLRRTGRRVSCVAVHRDAAASGTI